MSADIVFIDSYLCPHCRTELEARAAALAGMAALPSMRPPITSAGPSRLSLCANAASTADPSV